MSSSTTDRGTVRALLAEAGIRPSKKLGQNFLVEPAVLADIEAEVNAVAPRRVLEIGPGLGAVTEVLLRGAEHVVAVEVDDRLAEIIEHRLCRNERLTVLRSDILDVSVTEVLGELRGLVVGSLPYRISSPILKWLVDQRDAISGALVITQREVAEKIAASPGKEGTALGVLVQAYADVEILRRVARGCFFPVPDVESVLWRLTFRDVPRFSADSDVFFAVVRTLYGTRRKMVRGVLRALLPSEAVPEALAEAGVEETVRGEELSFDELDRLASSVACRVGAETGAVE